MRFELRKSGGHQCETCGAYDIIHADERPLTLDLDDLIEIELLRREVRLARIFSDERERLGAELEAILTGMEVDVNPWRLFKAHRERRFKRRVEAALAELYDLTRFPFTVPEAQRELEAPRPDRS